MNSLPTQAKRISRKKGRKTNLLELLLVLAILSVSLYPVAYIFKLGQPSSKSTQTEFLATLLAHHVMETIVASKNKNSDYLPMMTEKEPIVETHNSGSDISEYFLKASENNLPIDNNDDLYWSLKPFKCKVDTYYLEGSIYKVIVYISYSKEGKEMKVFLERLLTTSPMSK